jgi:uncharacterized protein HemX
METPAFNNELASELVKTGNQTYTYIAVGLVLLQLVIIPLSIQIFKVWQTRNEEKVKELQAAHKKIIDLETENRTQKRDAEIKEIKNDYNGKFSDLENRVQHLEKDLTNKIDRLSENFDKMTSTVSRMFEKVDKITEKLWQT